MEEYFHWEHIPEQLMYYLIDLKCEIDMGGHEPEVVRAMKEEFNKRVSSCETIVPYPL